MSRLLPLFGVALKSRVRSMFASRSGVVLLGVGAIFIVAMNVLLGFGLFVALRATRQVRPELLATAASWIATWFGVLALTRPIMFRNFAGGALTNVLHLPFSRAELLAFSFVTGVMVPLVFEMPVLIGATAGLSPSLAMAPVIFLFVALSQAVLLGATYAVSLGMIVMTRRRWLSDLAAVFGVFVFLLPAVLMQPAVARRMFTPGGALLTFLSEVAPLTPFGWAPRAAVFASRGDWLACAVFAGLAIALAVSLAGLSFYLLNRILDGDIQPDSPAANRAGSRIWLPGGLGAMIENEIRTIWRLPLARASLVTSMVMPAIWVALISQRGGISDAGLLLILVLSGAGASNLFAFMGRRAVTVFASPVWRGAILLSRNIADTILRVPMVVALSAILVFRGRGESVPALVAAIVCLWLVTAAMQNFASILRPYAIPFDRTNPLSSSDDGRQTAGSLMAMGFGLLAIPVSAPFLFLVWLGANRFEEYAFALIPLAVFGAVAVYAACVDIGGRMLERRETDVLEKLVDDRPV